MNTKKYISRKANELLQLQQQVKEAYGVIDTITADIISMMEKLPKGKTPKILIGKSADGPIYLVNNFAEKNTCFRSAAVRQFEIVQGKPEKAKKGKK